LERPACSDDEAPDGRSDEERRLVEVAQRGDVESAPGEVGSGGGRHLRRAVRAEVPDRVDLEQPAHEADDAGEHREERAALGREGREVADADDVVLGAAGPRELGVLLVPDPPDVQADERQQDAGQQEDRVRQQFPRPAQVRERPLLSGTVFGVVLSVPLSFLGARNLMGNSPAGLVLYGVVRLCFTVTRSIEVLIVGLITVVIVGNAATRLLGGRLVTPRGYPLAQTGRDRQ